MSLSSYPHFVRFCSVAATVNKTNVDCEAYRLRVAAIPLFEENDHCIIDDYHHFVDYYRDVLQTKKLDINDVIYALWHIAVSYYTEEQRQYIVIDTLTLRELFKEFNLIN